MECEVTFELSGIDAPVFNIACLPNSRFQRQAGLCDAIILASDFLTALLEPDIFRYNVPTLS